GGPALRNKCPFRAPCALRRAGSPEASKVRTCRAPRPFASRAGPFRGRIVRKPTKRARARVNGAPNFSTAPAWPARPAGKPRPPTYRLEPAVARPQRPSFQGGVRAWRAMVARAMAPPARITEADQMAAIRSSGMAPFRSGCEALSREVALGEAGFER